MRVTPFRIAGRQGLFNIPDELVKPIIPPEAMFDAWAAPINVWLRRRGVDTTKRAR
jgi:hypothetical protein